MNNSISISEIVISVVLIVLVVLFLDPFMILMPSSFVYSLVVVLGVLFFIFAGFVWREKATDERDELHRMIAGRVGYLSGVWVLVVALIYQAVQLHSVDPWVVVTLAVMIVTKLGGVWYSRANH